MCLVRSQSCVVWLVTVKVYLGHSVVEHLGVGGGGEVAPRPIVACGLGDS